MDKCYIKIIELKRKGATELEIWNVILNSEPFSDFWRSTQKNGAEDLKRWEKIIFSIQNINHSTFEIRKENIETLGEFGKQAECAVPFLIPMLNDSHDEVREKAVRALGKIRLNAKDAVLPLINILKEDFQLHLRYNAAWALGRISKKLPETIPALIHAVTYDHEFVRRDAAQALGEIKPKAIIAVPTLAKTIIKDNDEFVRLYAVSALGRIGELSPLAIQALEKASQEQKEIVNQAAKRTLKRLKEDLVI